MFKLIEVEYSNFILIFFRNLSVNIVGIPEMLKFILDSKFNVNGKHTAVELPSASASITIILVFA
jgi:hypothetical protein